MIKDRLAAAEDDAEDDPEGRRTARPRPLSRRELLDAAGIDEGYLTELEDFGLVRPSGRQYGPDALDAARIIVALGRYGVQARHLRAVRAAVERETSLIEQVVAPTRRQRSPGSRERAGQIAQEIAALSLQLHGSLMGSALADAGLQTDGLAQAARPGGGGLPGPVTSGGEPPRPRSGWGVRGMTSQDSPARPRPGPGHDRAWPGIPAVCRQPARAGRHSTFCQHGCTLARECPPQGPCMRQRVRRG